MDFSITFTSLISDATFAATRASPSHANFSPVDNLQPVETSSNVCLAGIQISRPSAILRPRNSFRLAASISDPPSWTQAGLAHTLESLAIDVCCLSETRSQDPSTVVKFLSPAAPEATCYLRLSSDMEAAAAGLAGVGITLSDKGEAALLNWFLINSRLCAVRLQGSCGINRHRDDTANDCWFKCHNTVGKQVSTEGTCVV
ncbi:unnamed protein product, partial [Dicrocoelium dendriticum]